MSWVLIIGLAAILIVFFVLSNRTNKKRQKETQEMLDCLSQKDDNPAFTPQQADAAYLRTYQKQMELIK